MTVEVRRVGYPGVGVTVNHQMWVLGTQFRSSGKVKNALNG